MRLGQDMPVSRFVVRAGLIEGRIGLLLLAILCVTLFLGILLSMDRVWMYYFVPPFPFAAIVETGM